MSATDRNAMRAAAQTALSADPRFAGFAAISAWVQSIDAGTLPALAVALPERRQSPDGQATNRNEVTLAVVVKRIGGDDIEAVLELDADAAEDAVLAALRRRWRNCDMTRATVTVDGGGERRVGTLTLTFAITYMTLR